MASRSHPQLTDYRRKRDPQRTPEPFGRLYIPNTNQLFVVQQHAASHLHFDLRLEVDGVLKSWAVPKGPSADPADKRLAMQTEDHPLDYADFEGEIPPGNYGAGHVIVWDRGRYQALAPFDEGFSKGKLLFQLHGHKLRGRWTLVKIKQRSGRDNTGKEWLLIKEQDAYAESPDSLAAATGSVLSGLAVAQLVDRHKVTRKLLRKAERLNRAEPAAAPAVSSRPMLATSGAAHNRPGWLWELKYDGYRILAGKQAGEVSLTTRNGHLISDRFPEICQVVSHLPIDDCLMDGELVVNDANGRPSFSLLQQRARSQSAHQVASSAITQAASYYCFDLLQLGHTDLRRCPLTTRKQILRQLLPEHSACIYSEHVQAKGLQTLKTAEQLGIEGVVGKRANSQYQSGRSDAWIKVRRQRTGDFVVAGWSAARNHPADIGALALAEYRGQQLTYVGHAGAGLSGRLRDQLAPLFRRLARKTSPLTQSPDSNRQIQWLRPTLVVEVAYAEYTSHGHLRQPSVQRLRDDKEARECMGHTDIINAADAESADLQQGQPANKVVVTNPDKIFFPEPGFSKADLVKYYRSIAPWLLPYLHNRPIVLTRYPDGVDGKSFYQRDVPDYVPDWLQRETLWSDAEPADAQPRLINYFVLNSEEDLAYLANMGTLPIHMWHSQVATLEQADWCVLDLDPKTAAFADVISLAQAIGSLCNEVELPAYVKTSGASGLHVLVPLHQQLSHEQSRTLGELLARIIVGRYSHIATITRRVRARQQKVYIDYLQNGHGRLIVAPYAVRAEQAGSVSMPLHWHEVKAGLSNNKFHMGNALRRVRRRADPMSALLTDNPDLVRSLALLGELFNASEIDAAGQV